MKKLYLVDVSSMFFRAFYAIRNLTSPKGMPVNALYGFLSMTIKLLRDVHPDYMAFCFDRPEPSFRKDLDPRYKANRTEMPEELVPQVPYIRVMSEALGIPCLDRPGFEADDIIGTLARVGREHGLEVVIVSGDKDFAQLIGPLVSMYDTMKDVRYDSSGVVEKWGIEPHQMIDYLALVGDSSDNIAGVAGIGPKGAQKLLKEFGSLNGIYKSLDSISSASLKKKLETGRDEAYLSQKLVTIVDQVVLEVAPEDLRLKAIDRDRLKELLSEFGFKSFAKTLLGENAGAETNGTVATQVGSPTEKKPVDGSNERGKEDVASRPVVVEKTLAVQVGSSHSSMIEKRLNGQELEQWLQPRCETWAMQTERGAFLAQKHGSKFEIAELAEYGEEMGLLISRKDLQFKGFDIKDFCKKNGVKKPKVNWDQMLAAYVIRSGQIPDVNTLFGLYNGSPLPELPSPSQILNAHLQLEEHLLKKLATVHGEKVLFEIELPLVPILLEMEYNGILLDSELLRQQSVGLTKDISALEKEIFEGLGVVFNIGSPKQLGAILFDKMKIPPIKKTKTGYSTDNEVLEKLAPQYPVTEKILHWRELSKLKSTYVDALPQLVDRSTGRIHTTFNQALTVTGRLSSVNPNLQNIPIRTERGNMIRKAFLAPRDHVLISADYSQIELRVLAHVTEDPGLIRAFENNLDIHTATASEIFDVPLAEVSSDMRRQAKAVNFGLAYGQGAFGLAENLRISRKEAAAIIERYFQRFSRVQTYMAQIVEEAKQKGFVETIFGRRRYVDEIYSNRPMVRKFGERAAINAPIQGAASDLVKLAMIKVGHDLPAKMLLQVHDELLFEVEKNQAESIRKTVTEKMEGIAQLKVPLRVNVGVGANWDEAH